MMPVTGIPHSHIKALQQRLQCSQEEYAMSQAWQMFLQLNETLIELIAESKKGKPKKHKELKRKLEKIRLKKKKGKKERQNPRRGL